MSFSHRIDLVKEKESQISCPADGNHSRFTPETVHPILSLQQKAGNQAVQHLLRNGLVQAKLAISSPGDPQEQEADQVADHVMRAHAGSAVAPCTCPAGRETCEECQKQQGTVARTSSGKGDLAVAHSALDPILHSPGQALDATTRAFFEPRFGHDFSSVRLHTDEHGADSAKAVNALAYTAGQHVVFGSNQYSPGTAEGQRLLAHELAHVVQQNGSPRGDSSGIVQRQPKPGMQQPRPCPPASQPVRQLPADFNNPLNVQVLAEIMWHEMRGHIAGSTAVGSIVLNRLLNTKFHKVSQLLSFEREPGPPESILDLACKLLTGQVADSTNGSENYFSPRSMPDESNHGCCTGQSGPCNIPKSRGKLDCKLGLQTVPGTDPPQRKFFPSFATSDKRQPQPEGTDPMLIQVYKP